MLVAAAIVALFGPLLQRNRPDLGATGYLIALGFVVLLLVSVLVHEAAHAIVARSHRYRVTRIVADFWGGHTAYEAGATRPGPSAAVAIAGPLANGALAGLGFLVLQVAPAGVPSFLATAFAISNAIVAGFNLLPGLPLDGGFLVEAAVWRLRGSRAAGTTAAGWAGRVIVLVGVLAMVLVPVARGVAPNLLHIAVTAALGAFLWFGASDAVRVGRLRRRMEATPVGDLIEPARFLPAASTLAQAQRPPPGLEEGAGAPGRPVVVLDPNGSPIGLLDPRAAAAVPAALRGGTELGALTSRFPPSWVVPLGPEGRGGAIEPVAQVIERHRLGAVVVVDAAGTPLGLIRSAALATLVS